MNEAAKELARLGELEWLVARAEQIGCQDPRRAAVFAIAITDGRPGWEAARMAGYSHGDTDDPATQRKNLAASAARTKRSAKVSALVKALNDRRNGAVQGVLDAKETLQLISEQARHGLGAQKVAALRLMANHHQLQMDSANSLSLRDLAEALQGHTTPLLRALGVATAAHLKRAGEPEFSDWEPPLADRDFLDSLPDPWRFVLSVVEVVQRVESVSKQNEAGSGAVASASADEDATVRNLLDEALGRRVAGGAGGVG